jgi:hypothetical protein
VTEDELKQIEARCNAATPGPWRVDNWRDRELRFIPNDYDEDETNVQVGGPFGTSENPSQADKDAEFVAHSRTDIPAMASALREAWAENEKLRKIVKMCGPEVPASTCGLLICARQKGHTGSHMDEHDWLRAGSESDQND